MSSVAQRVAHRFILGHRVAARYIFALAAQRLPGMVKDVINDVEHEKYEEAYEKYHKFLAALGIRSALKGDTVRIQSEWAHNMSPSDQSDYDRWLDELMNIRKRLQKAAYLRPGEMPQLGDIEWDLGLIQHNFVEWVTPFFRDDSDEFAHGPFKVILAPDAHDGMEEALKTLDMAAAKIKSKFAKVLYGKVYVTRGLKGGTYATAPSRAGSYVAATDIINLSLYATADRDSVMTLIHEFGHRYHTRFLSGEAREKFITLSTVGAYETYKFPLAERHKLADEYLEMLRKHRVGEFPEGGGYSDRAKLFFHNYDRGEWKAKVVPLVRRFRDDNDDNVEEELRAALGMFQYGGALSVETNQQGRHPLSASPYGATNWEENFAECFLHVCIGKSLPEPLEKFMDSL